MERVAVPVVQGGQPQAFLNGQAPVEVDPQVVNEMQARMIAQLRAMPISGPEAEAIAQKALLDAKRKEAQRIIESRAILAAMRGGEEQQYV